MGPFPRHSVSYVLGAEVAGTVPVQAPVLEGTQFSLATGTDLAKVGNTFGGWSDGSVTLAGGANYLMASTDVTFTAIWTPTVIITPAVTAATVTAQFNPGTTFIKPINVNALQAFVKEVKGKPGLVSRVVGIASSSKPNKADAQLAMRRAKTMVAMLKSLHVSATFITSAKVAGKSPVATLSASWNL